MVKPITLCYLYGDIMSTYGDRGNLVYLTHFLSTNLISFEVVEHNYGMPIPNVDIYIFGGGQDKAQLLVSQDLRDNNNCLINYLQDSYCLAICGGYQLLGKSYLTQDQRCIDGLGYLPVMTVAGKKRLSGYYLGSRLFNATKRTVVGFENHSGQTYILDDSQPFLHTISGNGNNGNDRGEGIVYQRTIGTYLHGPLLPRNPHIAYWWLRELLQERLGKRPDLQLERIAHQNIVKQFSSFSK